MEIKDCVFVEAFSDNKYASIHAMNEWSIFDFLSLNWVYLWYCLMCTYEYCLVCA